MLGGADTRIRVFPPVRSVKNRKWPVREMGIKRRFSAFLVGVQKQSTKLEFLLTVSRSVVYRTLWGTKQKIKIHFFVFSTLSGPNETKKTWKFVWQIGETKLRQISPKKKKTQILYFVLCLPQGMAFIPLRNYKSLLHIPIRIAMNCTGRRRAA